MQDEKRKNNGWKLWRKAMEYEYRTGYEAAVYDIKLAVKEAISKHRPVIIRRRRTIGPKSIRTVV